MWLAKKEAPGPTIPSVTIGEQVWSTIYLTPELSGIETSYKQTIHGETIYYYSYDQLQNVIIPSGWRLPTFEDCSALANYLSTNSQTASALISVSDGGTDLYGLNLYITGYYSNSTQSQTGRPYFAVVLYSGSVKAIGLKSFNESTIVVNNATTSFAGAPIRLIKNVA